MLFLGILDSTLVFFLPLGIDAVVILMAARHPSIAWLYPVLASAGSLIGAGITYWAGHKIGSKGLSRFVPQRRLDGARAYLRSHGAFAVAALALIPPPFPFTPFVLTAGALHVSRMRLFPLLGLARLIRFGLEAWLAVTYGEQLTRWMAAEEFKIGVWVFVGIAVLGTIASALVIYRRSRRIVD